MLLLMMSLSHRILENGGTFCFALDTTCILFVLILRLGALPS